MYFLLSYEARELLNEILFKCWENYVGKELYKLIVVDFVLQFVFLVTESVQTAISYVTKPSFKPVFSLETKFLDLLYVQSIFWLSIYFSPFLCIFAPFYYLIKFYLNKVIYFFNSHQIKNRLYLFLK